VAAARHTAALRFTPIANRIANAWAAIAASAAKYPVSSRNATCSTPAGRPAWARRISSTTLERGSSLPANRSAAIGTPSSAHNAMSTR